MIKDYLDINGENEQRAREFPDEEISQCCGAGTYGDYMMCEDCKEHC